MAILTILHCVAYHSNYVALHICQFNIDSNIYIYCGVYIIYILEATSSDRCFFISEALSPKMVRKRMLHGKQTKDKTAACRHSSEPDFEVVS